MLYLNGFTIWFTRLTDTHLTLTSVVFELGNYKTMAIIGGNLTLTSVVFESTKIIKMWLSITNLTLTSVVFEFRWT